MPESPALDLAPTGAHAVLETLRRWGVDRIFICPGTTEVAILDASFDYPDIEIVLATHESVVVAMADGYARATGRPAVAYLHTNVGLTNGLSHLHCAQVTGIPVVVLTGLKSTAILNGRGFTSNSHVREIVRPLVKWDWQTLRADAVAEDVDRALRLAVADESGPTFLALPQDLLERRYPVPLVPAPDDVARGLKGRSVASDADLQRAVEILTSAERPLIIAGADVATGGASAVLLEIAELIGAPVVAEDRRTLRMIPVRTDHSHYVGMLDRDGELLAESDVIFTAGIRAFTEFEPSDRPSLGTGRRLVQLQTSREEIIRLGSTDVALVGDSGPTLARLRKMLSGGAPPPTQHLERARERYEMGRERLRAAERDDSEHLRVPNVMGRLVAHLPADAIVVADAVTSELALLHRLTVRNAADFHVSGGGGSLGWGMGAALGVALDEPDRPVVCVIGDGVFQFGIPALWTAVKYDLRVTFIVVNNRSYAAVKRALVRHGGQSARTEDFPATDISGPDIAMIAAGFGMPSWRAETAEELDRALEGAFGVEGPTLIEILTDPDDLGFPRAKSLAH